MMKGQKGITLVALIITIIVMLILVAVTISVALNGGIFSTARDAANRTNVEVDKEKALANGLVNYNGNMQTLENIANGAADAGV